MKNAHKGHILLTGVGGDIGQSVIQCLLKTEYADRLCGCDLDPCAAGKALLKRFKVAPAVSNEKTYENFISKLVDNLGVSYILPLTESEISYFSRELSYYESLGVKVLILDKDIIQTFLDKYETIKFLNANDFSTPKTYLARDYKGQLGFPVIFKHRQVCGSKGVIQIRDQEELDFHLKMNPECIIQELVGNVHEEYTVGVFSDGRDVYSIAFQRYLGYGSMTKFARLVEDKRLSSLAEKIAWACKLVGPLNMQLRKTPKGFLPFEINPRISSTVYFRHCFGFEDAKWWLDIFHGKKITYSPKFKTGVAVRTVGGVFFDMEERK